MSKRFYSSKDATNYHIGVFVARYVIPFGMLWFGWILVAAAISFELGAVLLLGGAWTYKLTNKKKGETND